MPSNAALRVHEARHNEPCWCGEGHTPAGAVQATLAALVRRVNEVEKVVTGPRKPGAKDAG